mgnify:CR=1 FL=1
MRCIETMFGLECVILTMRLIETWDVLKHGAVSKSPIGMWLIETWDVLKLILWHSPILETVD